MAEDPITWLSTLKIIREFVNWVLCCKVNLIHINVYSESLFYSRIRYLGITLTFGIGFTRGSAL